MNKIKNLILILQCAIISGFAQQNITIAPPSPQAGDIITVTYIPAGELANTQKKVEGSIYISTNTNRKADDLTLTKTGKKYITTIKTDTASNFIQLGFYVDKIFDTNFGEGYTILLRNGEVEKRGAYANKALFYQYYGGSTGIESNRKKALEAYEQEIKLYPESKRKFAYGYFNTLVAENKSEALTIIQKEIELTLKNELRTEDDYNYLETLYTVAKLREQAKHFNTLMREKFPTGKWQISDLLNRFYDEANFEKKRELYNEIKQNIATKPEWKSFEESLPNYQASLLRFYIKEKRWQQLKEEADKITNKAIVASIFNDAAWQLQGKDQDLQQAEELSRFATEFAKNQIKNPVGKKPDYVTGKEWIKERELTYAMYADTYAMVMYKLGDFKKGYPFAKEAAQVINKGNDIDQNYTYALLAEKVLEPAQLKTELEQFVRNGKSNGDIKAILKRIYTAEKKSEDGFENYITTLEKESYNNMLAELKKSMISETAPSFALLDLEGKKVSLQDLKGKTIILDFWATWCGPCLASFPGMQKMVTKYKDNPDVKFLFVDTWESGDNKEKKAQEFIESNKYTFHVIMDNDNEVVAQYGVNGIPTKFIIDKEGKVRFKSMGFNGSDDKLIAELTAMIELVNSPEGSN